MMKKTLLFAIFSLSTGLCSAAHATGNGNVTPTFQFKTKNPQCNLKININTVDPNSSLGLGKTYIYEFKRNDSTKNVTLSNKIKSTSLNSFNGNYYATTAKIETLTSKHYTIMVSGKNCSKIEIQQQG